MWSKSHTNAYIFIHQFFSGKITGTLMLLVPDAGGDRPISPSSNENENSPPSKAAEKRSSRDYVDEDVLKEDIREVIHFSLLTLQAQY